MAASRLRRGGEQNIGRFDVSVDLRGGVKVGKTLQEGAEDYCDGGLGEGAGFELFHISMYSFISSHLIVEEWEGAASGGRRRAWQKAQPE